MLYAALLVVVSIMLTVVGVSALGQSQGELPALALAIPALWLLPQGGVSAWLLLIGLGSYGVVLQDQPLALSISLFMMLPVFAVSFSPKGSWQLATLLISIVLAMDIGLMALQGEGKLIGSPAHTIVQIIAVLVIWVAVRSWRPVNGNTWWPLFLVFPLWVGGMEYAALVALCITGLIASLQGMQKSQLKDLAPRMIWILPAIGFATLVLTPWLDVPNPVLVSWLLILGGALLGEYLLEDPEEEV
ncbi:MULTISPECIES: hypothetical protein [Photobacterium]|uniref:Membrane protein n=1 Tax=Photobacterium ganghwense TaxID=320778 RepID=A0A0J1H0B1_9GAMM|nr:MULTISPECIES: hypothetical protein [Photobacterium]KLV05268.1 membrane protein [Photobacterium ganghwense]MBV1840873.1 hypothetical protein [Photobacterium ganghwense]PSU07998.1 hypothetical protein C9I92_10660 [Photobacterium ganghwense]QSV14824.1 hypothetical protein FH974_04290 [Photobacterium ganghwense]